MLDDMPLEERRGGPGEDTHLRVGDTRGESNAARVHQRALVTQMNDALAAQEHHRFLGLGETLMMLTQQHNMKEENILYPIMDQVIAGEAENLKPS